MSVHSDIKALASTALSSTLEEIERAGREALAAEELQRKEMARRVRLEKQARRKIERELELKLDRRRSAAYAGVRALLELSQIPELLSLAKLSGFLQPCWGSVLPLDGFAYYAAWDDNEHTQVVLYPGRVVVDYGAEEGGRTIEFHAKDSQRTIMRELKQIVYPHEYPTFLVQETFEKPGDHGDLGGIAFQVLVEASNAARMVVYFKRALSLIGR